MTTQRWPQAWGPIAGAVAVIAAVPLPVAAAGDTGDITEIVVTSRRREEKLLEVPISLNVLAGDEIANRRIVSFAELAAATPGLYFESFNAGTVSTPVIRGLSQQTTGGFDQQVSNNVGTFIDGVYQTNRNGFMLDLLDIERVEVVKGPASALYGRATFSGAINLVTRRPGDEARGTVRGDLGSDEGRSLFGSWSGPIAGSGIKGRVSAGYSSFDGTFDNTEDPGDKLQGFRNTGVSGGLLFALGERTELDVSALFARQDNEHSGQYLQTDLNCGTLATGFSYFCGEASYREPVSISPEAFGAETETGQLVARLTTDFDAFRLVAIGAYTRSKSDLLFDADYGPGGALHPVCEGTVTFPGVGTVPCGFSPAPVVTRQQRAEAFNVSANDNDDYSLEVRLQSTGEERLTWLVGAFAFESSADIDARFGTDSSGLAPGEFFATQVGVLTARADPIGNAAVATDFTSDVRTLALFGSLGFDFTDRLHAGVEARFEQEKKELESRVNNFGPGFAQRSETWNAFTPRFTVDYTFGEATLTYLSAARGFRSGGFNPSFPTTFPGEATYDSETNWTYELGIKSPLLDSRVTVSAAVFYIDWQDMQIAGASESPTFPGSVIRNTGSATSKGFELEVRATPVDGLTGSIAFAHADPEFDSGVIDRSAAFQCAPDICDLTPTGPNVGGNRLPRTVRNQLTADIAYTRPLNDRWALFVRSDYTWQDDVFRESINKISYGERSLLGASLGIERDNLTLSLWGRNLLDDEFVTYGAFQPRSFTSRAVDYTQSLGRRYGVGVAYRF